MQWNRVVLHMYARVTYSATDQVGGILVLRVTARWEPHGRFDRSGAQNPFT